PHRKSGAECSEDRDTEKDDPESAPERTDRATEELGRVDAGKIVRGAAGRNGGKALVAGMGRGEERVVVHVLTSARQRRGRRSGPRRRRVSRIRARAGHRGPGASPA